MSKSVVVIGGAGKQSGFSESLINKLLSQELHVVGIVRSDSSQHEMNEKFAHEKDVEIVCGDLTDNQFVETTISDIESRTGPIDAYIHNATELCLKPFLETTSEDFEQSWQKTVITATLVARALLPKLLTRKKGNLIFTGATASIRGSKNASPFAVAKFGLRALSQSLAREFAPQGVHVAHVITDGVIVGRRARDKFGMDEAKCIQPDALADLYINLLNQDPSCWTHELDLRPFGESF